jgi:tetraacyldisaccharide 4'-kinase
MRAPAFWDADGALARALVPASWLWSAGARLREATATPFRAPIPVICIGNFTVGGAGKTPVALAIGARLAAAGRRVAFLTRGHGGRLAGPVAVDPAMHDAEAVGDEPLLLAAVAPTLVARDRAAGARAAAAAGATALVMDDGLQNPGLAKDLALAVIDGETGFGNGRVVPAGPLRESVARGLARADAAIIVGDDRAGLAAALPARLPALRARLAPENGEAFRGARVAAFAGIARPEKFFATLRALGAELVEARGFADHHRYGAGEVEALLDAATRSGARLVTTAKDAARLPATLRARVEVLRVRATFADEPALDALLAKALRD